MTDQPIAPALPSATVILLRDTPQGLETLLLRRNSKLVVHGGAWVFPGGMIDPEDHPDEPQEDMTAAARQAAIREAQEEAGLAIAPTSLVFFAHWTTPITRPRRFSTWFFAAPALEDTVQIDGGEIHAHRWMSPTEGLEAQRVGDIELPPPTFVTLQQLTTYRSVEETLTTLGGQAPETFFPRFVSVDDGTCSLYEADAGYQNHDPDAAGPRHRLWMVQSGWRYERAL